MGLVSEGLVSDDQLEAIHLGSLKVLAQTGLRVLHPGARRIMHEAGADVNESSGMVRFDPEATFLKLTQVHNILHLSNGYPV